MIIIITAINNNKNNNDIIIRVEGLVSNVMFKTKAGGVFYRG